MTGAVNGAAVLRSLLQLAITDSTPSGSNSGASPSGSVSSNSTTVSVTSGGSGSYTYAWTQVGSPATSGPFTPGAPSNATTGWSDTITALDSVKSELWRCTVTDTGNGKVATIDATVTLNWIDIT